MVLKWVVVICLLVLLSGLMRPGLMRRLRLGHLPGDLHLRLGRRRLHFPFTSTLLLSLLAWLLFRTL
jgi:hypothetical protein